MRASRARCKRLERGCEETGVGEGELEVISKVAVSKGGKPRGKIHKGVRVGPRSIKALMPPAVMTCERVLVGKGYVRVCGLDLGLTGE